MKHIRSWASGVLAAVLLVACGGDDPYVPGQGQPSGAPTAKGSFSTVIVFGDSLSDAGSYTPATSVTADGNPPFIGGKWTTNTTSTGTVPNTAKVWVEVVADSLGIPIFAAEMGWGASVVPCPVQYVNPALASKCTAYAQGGSMVTEPNGYGHASGALTVPVKTQIAKHLAKPAVGGKFSDSDLIFVWVGGNEMFVHYEAFAAQVLAIVTKPGLSEDQIKGLILTAQLDAMGKMKTAALELAGYVKSEILGKGGRYVAVINLPDGANSPYGTSFATDPKTKPLAPILLPVLSATMENFNFWLREGLTDQPVMLIDFWGLYKDMRANPSKYGFTNVNDPTCNFAVQDLVLGRVLTSGRALFCNVTTGTPLDMKKPGSGADPATWMFADDTHPSTGAHAKIAQEFIKQMRAQGWIN